VDQQSLDPEISARDLTLGSAQGKQNRETQVRETIIVVDQRKGVGRRSGPKKFASSDIGRREGSSPPTS
jgi:hypothetical protein